MEILHLQEEFYAI